MKTKKYLKPALLLLLILLSFSPSLAQGDKIVGNEIHFTNGDLNFSGKLFLPTGDGKFPAIVILHGGSSNVKAHRSTSTYYARRFAIKGIVDMVVLL